MVRSWREVVARMAREEEMVDRGFPGPTKEEYVQGRGVCATGHASNQPQARSFGGLGAAQEFRGLGGT